MNTLIIVVEKDDQSQFSMDEFDLEPIFDKKIEIPKAVKSTTINTRKYNPSSNGVMTPREKILPNIRGHDNGSNLSPIDVSHLTKSLE
jgi:hypothetical protein